MPVRRLSSARPCLPRPGRARAAGASILVAAALLVAGHGASAEAPCTVAWDGGAGTNGWSDDANWSENRQPGDADVVCIGSGADVSFSIVSETVAALRVDGSLTVAAQDLRVASGTDSHVDGSLTLTGGH